MTKNWGNCRIINHTRKQTPINRKSTWHDFNFSISVCAWAAFSKSISSSATLVVIIKDINILSTTHYLYSFFLLLPIILCSKISLFSPISYSPKGYLRLLSVFLVSPIYSNRKKKMKRNKTWNDSSIPMLIFIHTQKKLK